MSFNIQTILETEDTRYVKERLQVVAAGGRVRLALEGAAGTGKAHAVKIAAEEKSMILLLHAKPDPTRAHYKPLAEALWSFLARAKNNRKFKEVAVEVAGDLLSLLPLLGGIGEKIKAVYKAWNITESSVLGESFSVAQRLAAILNRIAQESPTVLLMEDFTRYDWETLQVLNTLFFGGETPYSLVLTYDETTVSGAPDDERGKLNRYIESLRNERGFITYPFRCLERDELKLFIEAYVGGAIFSARRIDEVCNRTGGNFEYVKSYLHQLHSDGIIEELPTGFSFRSQNRLPICKRAADDVQDRMQSLTNPQKEILEAASVLGEKFNIDFVSKILARSGQAPDRLTVARELQKIAQKQRLITEVDARHYQFTEAYLRDCIYHSLGVAIARDLHLIICESLRKEQPSATQLLFLHSKAAGQTGEALVYAKQLLAECRSKSDQSTTLAYSREVCELMRSTDAPASEIGCADEALLSDSQSAEAAGSFSDAIAAYSWLTEHSSNVFVRGRALLRLGVSRWVAEGPSEALATLERVIRRYSDLLSPLELLEARMAIASIQYHIGDWGSARENYKVCFRTEELARNPVLLASTRRIMNMFYFAETTLPLLRDSLRELRTNQNLPLYWEMRHNLGCIHLLSGELEAAQIIFAEAHEYFQRTGQYQKWLSLNNLGIIALLRGDYDEAEELFRPLAETELSPFEVLSARCHLAVVGTLRERGGAVRELETLAESIRPVDENQLREFIYHNLGWAQMRSGKRDEALASLRQALPASYTPWAHFQAARTNRLLKILGEIVATDGSEILHRSGRRDKWSFIKYDFAFNELWCWE